MKIREIISFLKIYFQHSILFAVAGTMVGFWFGGYKAGDPTADNALAQVFVHVLLVEWLGELGARSEKADATFQPGDDQHQRNQCR